MSYGRAILAGALGAIMACTGTIDGGGGATTVASGRTAPPASTGTTTHGPGQTVAPASCKGPLARLEA